MAGKRGTFADPPRGLFDAEPGAPSSPHDSGDATSAGVDRAAPLAERMRALHATPDGRPDVVAEQTSLAEFPAGEVLTHDAIDLMTAAVEQTVRTMRTVHDEVDEADPTSADILHGIIEKLEQQAWFLSAETRKPAS